MERTITAEQTARFAQALQAADRAPGTIHHRGSHQRAQLQEACHRRGLDLSDQVSFSPM